MTKNPVPFPVGGPPSPRDRRRASATKPSTPPASSEGATTDAPSAPSLPAVDNASPSPPPQSAPPEAAPAATAVESRPQPATAVSKESVREPLQRRVQHRRPSSIRVVERLVPYAAGVFWLMAAITAPQGAVRTFARIGLLAVLVWRASKTSVFRHLIRVRFSLPETAPSNGVRGFLWKYAGSWLYARLGWKFLERLNWHDRDKRATEIIWSLKDVVHPTIVIMNSQGGSGKTPLANYMAAVLAKTLNLPVVLLDANENDGNTADLAGIERSKTILLREFIARRHEFRAWKAFSTVVAAVGKIPMLVIGSDWGKNDPIDPDEFREALRIAAQNGQALVIDSGNGTNNVTNHVSAETGGSIVFVANNGTRGSRRKTFSGVKSTQAQLQKAGMEAKVARSLIVVLGDRSGSARKHAGHFNWPAERVFAVPHDKYMKSGAPTDPTKVSLKVMVTLKEAWVKILEGYPASDPSNAEAPADPASVESLPPEHDDSNPPQRPTSPAPAAKSDVLSTARRLSRIVTNRTDG